MMDVSEDVNPETPTSALRGMAPRRSLLLLLAGALIFWSGIYLAQPDSTPLPVPSLLPGNSQTPQIVTEQLLTAAVNSLLSDDDARQLDGLQSLQLLGPAASSVAPQLLEVFPQAKGQQHFNLLKALVAVAGRDAMVQRLVIADLTHEEWGLAAQQLLRQLVQEQLLSNAKALALIEERLAALPEGVERIALALAADANGFTSTVIRRELAARQRPASGILFAEQRRQSLSEMPNDKLLARLEKADMATLSDGLSLLASRNLDNQLYLPFLYGLLGRADVADSALALVVLGQMRQRGAAAVPLLALLLDHPNLVVAAHAAYALRDLGTLAIAAVPKLQSLQRDFPGFDPDPVKSALNAIQTGKQ